MVSLYVGNIPEDKSSEDLQRFFKDFPILAARIPEPKNGFARGFGFVTVREADVLPTLKAFVRKEWDGRQVRVTRAKPNFSERFSGEQDSSTSVEIPPCISASNRTDMSLRLRQPNGSVVKTPKGVVSRSLEGDLPSSSLEEVLAPYVEEFSTCGIPVDNDSGRSQDIEDANPAADISVDNEDRKLNLVERFDPTKSRNLSVCPESTSHSQPKKRKEKKEKKQIDQSEINNLAKFLINEKKDAKKVKDSADIKMENAQKLRKKRGLEVIEYEDEGRDLMKSKQALEEYETLEINIDGTARKSDGTELSREERRALRQESKNERMAAKRALRAALLKKSAKEKPTKKPKLKKEISTDIEQEPKKDVAPVPKCQVSIATDFAAMFSKADDASIGRQERLIGDQVIDAPAPDAPKERPEMIVSGEDWGSGSLPVSSSWLSSLQVSSKSQVKIEQKAQPKIEMNLAGFFRDSSSEARKQMAQQTSWLNRSWQSKQRAALKNAKRTHLRNVAK